MNYNDHIDVVTKYNLCLIPSHTVDTCSFYVNVQAAYYVMMLSLLPILKVLCASDILMPVKLISNHILTQYKQY